MPRLFTYIIPIDDGSAPNPFHGMCSLAICKPGIRRVANKEDWVAGVGSKNAPSGDLSGHLVYAMRIEEVLPLSKYDQEARSRWPLRIPNMQSADLAELLGDCIYDYSSGTVVQRRGVHGPANQATDLSGENVLISRDFYYFGSRAIRLPDSLLPICPNTQGHRSTSNDPYVSKFVSWLRNMKLTPGQLYGWPDFIVDWAVYSARGGCTPRKLNGERDHSDC
jgi:hypothetical protein